MDLHGDSTGNRCHKGGPDYVKEVRQPPAPAISPLIDPAGFMIADYSGKLPTALQQEIADFVDHPREHRR